MTAILPAGLEYKLLGAAADWVPRRFQTKSLGVDAGGVWGSEFPDEEGVRTQIVAVTGVRDEVGDIIVPGAFRDTLAALEPKVVLGHDWNRPVGMPRAIEELLPGDPRLPKVDRFGKPWPVKAGALFARTEYMLGTKDGRDAYEHAKFYGPKLATSIGYVPDDEHTRHDIDPDTGLPTRFLGKLALYEYGQVLHGAHPLAGGLKSAEVAGGKIQRKRRPARPSLEFKIRLVRDAGYWGYPIGTPIRPGMRPIGPKATRTRATGQEPREDLGAVEIDANNLRIKPSGKKKWRNEAATDAAYDGLADLIADEDADPFDSPNFTTVDSAAINKGEEYNPLDVLIANAVVPADLEDWLRGSDFTSVRLGDREDVDAQAAVEGRITDVMDAYREKYNAELVRQNDTGDGEVPDPDAPPPTDEEAARAEAERAQGRAVRGGAPTEDRAGQIDQWAQTGRELLGAEKVDTRDSNLFEVVHELNADRPGWDSDRSDATIAELAASPAPERLAELDRMVAEARERAGVPASSDDRAAPADIGQPAGSYPTDDQFRASQEAVAAQDAAAGRTAPQPPEGATRGVPDAAAPAATGDMNDPASLSDEQLAAEIDAARQEMQAARAGSDARAQAKLKRDVFEDEQDRRQREGEADRPAGTPSRAEVDRMAGTSAGDAAIKAEAMSDDELAAMDAALDARMEGVGKPGVVRGAHQAIKDELAKRGPAAPEEAADESEVDAVEGVDQAVPGEAVPDGVEPADTAGLSTEDGRTLLPVDPEPAEKQAFELTDESGRRLRVFELNRPRDIAKPWAFDIIEADGTRTEGEGTYSTPGSALVRAEADFGGAVPTGEGADATDVDTAQTEANRENTARIEADELAAAEEAADAGFGLTEAPDGELEADPDVADRQDRVGSLLVQDEAGTLDLSPDRLDDEGLRVTRSDLVAEIGLQDHLERRRRGERTRTRREQQQEAAAAGEETDAAADAEDAEPEDTGPKPRPGVAGAAEDYADALEEGDPERVAATRARLQASLNRSRSDSEQVANLRELVEADAIPSPEDLRAAADAIRAEQRARRNEAARTRRKVRRFERERLRSLLGQVESEMRNRNLDFDPLPDPDGDGTEVIPVTVTGWTDEPDPFSPEPALKLDGANYGATVSGPVGPDRVVTFTWAVLSEDGNTLAGGSGKVADQEAGRAAVELALEVQRNIGALPPDALPPTGSLSTGSSATPPADVLTAADTMRKRVAEGREVNPLTGLPDPLNERGPTLVPLAGQVFEDAEQVRVYLERRAITDTRLAPALASIRWDTMKTSPGGAFFIAERSDERGTELYHAASGYRYHYARMNDQIGAAGDLLRFASILERLPDDTGRVIDWSNPDGAKLVESMKEWKRGEQSGAEAVNGAAIEALTAEKVRAGQWNHKLVARASDWSSGHSAVTNPARLKQARELGNSIGQLIDTRPKYATADGKRTLEIIKGASTLEKMGAPDAAAVLLRRRAAELREKYDGDKAIDQGAGLLDRTAEAYLSAYSPVRSPGDRVVSIRPGERLFTTDHSGNGRSFRVLAEPRREGGYYNASLYPVVEEGTGKQLYLNVSDRDVRIIADPHQNFGAEFQSNRDTPDFVVLDRDEEPPADLEELRARTRGEAGAIPTEVLDSAAEALPESRAETAARRGTPNPTGVRPPRRSSVAAPRRKAPEPAALPPAAEENLAIAQTRGLDTFYGGVTLTKAEPAPGGFASLDEVAEHLRGVLTDGWAKDARAAEAVLDQIDKEQVTLSPGGHLLIHKKTGNIAHAGTGLLIWPTAGGAREEVTLAGFDINASMGAKVAEVFESYAFDGQVLPWSRDPKKSVAGIRAAKERLGGADPTVLATRAGYFDGVLEQRTIKGKDALMLRNMIRASVPGDQTANPQALAPVGQVSRPYSDAWGTRTRQSPDEYYVSTTKSGATLARRVMMELYLADYIGQAAPLDVVRRLSALADELEGKTIETTNGKGGSKTLVPSDDLRTAIRAIIDANDESRPSTAARLRRSGYRGTVRPTGDVEVHTAGSTWYGTAGTRTEELLNETHDAVKDGGGIRFYTDEQGRRHATFVDIDIIDKDPGRYRDPNMLPTLVPGTPGEGWIRVDDDGRLTLEFKREKRHLVVSLPPGSWSFEPEEGAPGQGRPEGGDDNPEDGVEADSETV